MLPRAIALLAMMSIASCSWVFVTPPPGAPAPNAPIACTQGRAAPALDALIATPAALLGVFGLVLFASSSGEGQDIGKGIGGIMLLSGGATAAVFGMSAHYGFSRTARCRELVNPR